METTVTPEVISERIKICQTCDQYFRSTCLQGHVIQSWPGCPKKKFPPFNAHFGYAEPRKQTVRSEGAACCTEESVRYMTWPEAMAEAEKTFAEWIRSGLPLAKSVEHNRRFDLCKKCPHYRHFQCLVCKCVAYAKAKLASAHCPAKPPQW